MNLSLKSLLSSVNKGYLGVFDTSLLLFINTSITFSSVFIKLGNT